ESLTQTLIVQLPADGYRVFAAATVAEEIGAASDRDDFLAAANSDELSERDRACVNQLLEIYVAAKEVIRLQLHDASDEELRAKQRELSNLYAGFRMRFGYINKNIKKLSPHSPVVPFLKALEIPVGRNLYNRAPLFSERTIRPARRQAGKCEPKDVLL